MKSVSANLNDVVVGSYDQTKTSIFGNVYQKTINSKLVLGPSQNRWIDLLSDSAITAIGGVFFVSSNGRIFSASTEAAGLTTLVLHEMNFVTGVVTYVGKLQLNTPDVAATTTTHRSLKVIDTGTTGWKIFVTTTASVLINGGPFMANNVDRADFTPSGSVVIPFATGNSQKAVYFMQDPANIGVGNLNTVAVGSVLDAPNNRYYVHNGVAATHQYYVFDLAATPTYVSSSVSVNVATPGVVTHGGHTYAANTPVVFISGTLPTGLTVGTVYFVRNPVAGVSYELSATSGGASITTTGSPSVSAVIGRAFGTSDSNFLHKTGNLPVIAGTLLASSEVLVVPQHTANAGLSCVFFASSTTLHLGLLSELTSGATTWPSLATSNLVGTANQTTALTATQATFSQTLDCAFFISNTSRIIGKQVLNNVIRHKMGTVNIDYYESVLSPLPIFGVAAVADLQTRNGWAFLMATNATTGQRGIIATDLRSDQYYDYSYVISKVLNTPDSIWKYITSLEESVVNTDEIKVQYRTSGFGSASGGWADITPYSDISAVASAAQVQFKILFNVATEFKGNPAQIHDLVLGTISNTEISENWEFSRDKSDNTTPSRVAFRLKTVYASGTVPTSLTFKAYDLTNVLLVSHSLMSNPGNFEYSTNNGVSWLPLGTVPNTVGTLIRYTFSSPPGVDIRPGLLE